MIRPALSLVCLAVAGAAPALAAPVEFDTPSAHIIVVRPVDIWSGDSGAQAESEALVKAIVCATGADTTPQAIEAARASDLAYRASVWTARVADHECGPDAGLNTAPKADPSPDTKPAAGSAPEQGSAPAREPVSPPLSAPEPAASSTPSGERPP